MKEKLSIENKIAKEYFEMNGLKVINRKGNLFINLNDIVDDNNFQTLNIIREFIKDPKNFKKKKLEEINTEKFLIREGNIKDEEIKENLDYLKDNLMNKEIAFIEFLSYLNER